MRTSSRPSPRVSTTKKRRPRATMCVGPTPTSILPARPQVRASKSSSARSLTPTTATAVAVARSRPPRRAGPARRARADLAAALDAPTACRRARCPRTRRARAAAASWGWRPTPDGAQTAAGQRHLDQLVGLLGGHEHRPAGAGERQVRAAPRQPDPPDRPAAVAVHQRQPVGVGQAHGQQPVRGSDARPSGLWPTGTTRPAGVACSGGERAGSAAGASPSPEPAAAGQQASAASEIEHACGAHPDSTARAFGFLTSCSRWPFPRRRRGLRSPAMRPCSGPGSP